MKELVALLALFVASFAFAIVMQHTYFGQLAPVDLPTVTQP